MSYSKVQPGRILINSLPKSGTNLLTKAVEIFGYEEYFTSRSHLKRVEPDRPRFFNYGEVKEVLKKTKNIQNTANSDEKTCSFGKLRTSSEQSRTAINADLRGSSVDWGLKVDY